MAHPRRRGGHRRPALLAGSAVVALSTLTGCATGATQGPGAKATGHDGEITVFAAASLQGSFTELADRFEAANPGARVTLNFAGSADLATQITEGAPADIFAAADARTMDRLADTGALVGQPVDFATNVLALAVPPDNPAGITSLADAARPGVKTVVCTEQVPCGAATATAERAAGFSLTPVSEESSVTAVLGKVLSGEADAGLVYVTDVRAAGDAVLGIEVPEAADAVTTYPIAALTGAAAPGTARAFVDFVTSAHGRAVLGDAGFGAP